MLTSTASRLGQLKLVSSRCHSEMLGRMKVRMSQRGRR